ncbi:ATPase/DNA packaging protein, partial [Shewanella sp.]|uniref:ATPase/DNA packaging protein n=1 Tax=Shewanella sp. TaxID=50422 RepID=UPI0040547B40
MKLTLLENEKPPLPKTEMLCDMELHKKLNKYELTKFLNRHTANLLCGRAGSGKTSLLFSMFKSPDIFKKVFHNVFLFQPFASASSVKNNIFDAIPDEQKFDDMNEETLGEVMNIVRDEDKKYNNAIVIDDMTAKLKDKEVEKLLKELIFNRRHYRCSVFFLVQSFISVPSQIRKLFSNLFIFKVSKKELETIRDEILETIPRDCVGALSKLVYDKPH